MAAADPGTLKPQGCLLGRGGAEELGGDLWRERQANGLQVDRVWRQKRA